MGFIVNRMNILGQFRLFGENTMFWSGTCEYCDQITGERYKLCMNWEKLYISYQESVFCYSLQQLQGK